ncbi:unnamed protein product [Didymodactylos carnosus]|uniref:Uncharacterized protein n=1 Tax=Didymodactylos carnosus TaxID=1234261 RepID=A0A8S2D1U3_9BILA|nr:unnamed protein product [Didymodactylos carnosus]CAF3641849.1 unnamed protein product [Didymodactylos carnosus]
MMEKERTFYSLKQSSNEPSGQSLPHVSPKINVTLIPLLDPSHGNQVGWQSRDEMCRIYLSEKYLKFNKHLNSNSIASDKLAYNWNEVIERRIKRKMISNLHGKCEDGFQTEKRKFKPVKKVFICKMHAYSENNEYHLSPFNLKLIVPYLMTEKPDDNSFMSHKSAKIATKQPIFVTIEEDEIISETNDDSSMFGQRLVISTALKSNKVE